MWKPERRRAGRLVPRGAACPQALRRGVPLRLMISAIALPRGSATAPRPSKGSRQVRPSPARDSGR